MKKVKYRFPIGYKKVKYLASSTRERAYLDDKILEVLRWEIGNGDSCWLDAFKVLQRVGQQYGFGQQYGLDLVRRRLLALSKKEKNVHRRVKESWQKVNSWDFGGAAVCKRKTAEYKWEAK